MADEKRQWAMPLFMEAYNDLSSNGKTVEGRVPDYEKPEKDYRPMKSGDVLSFFAVRPEDFSPIEGIPEIRIMVESVRHYESVESMLDSEGIENLLPNAKSMKEAVSTYLGFPGYPERIKKYGIYAIRLGKE